MVFKVSLTSLVLGKLRHPSMCLFFSKTAWQLTSSYPLMPWEPTSSHFLKGSTFFIFWNPSSEVQSVCSMTISSRTVSMVGGGPSRLTAETHLTQKSSCYLFSSLLPSIPPPFSVSTLITLTGRRGENSELCPVHSFWSSDQHCTIRLRHCDCLTTPSLLWRSETVCSCVCLDYLNIWFRLLWSSFPIWTCSTNCI